MFDDFVRSVWDVGSIPIVHVPERGPDEMFRFQDLIQSLVSPGDLNDQSTLRSTSFGTRLKLAQRQMAKRKPRSTQPQPPRRPVVSSAGSFRSTGSLLSGVTRETDSSFGDTVDLADFIHIDAMETASSVANPSYDQEPASQSRDWKSVNPVVVLLLASVAFSVILTAISGKPRALKHINAHSNLFPLLAIQSGCTVYRPKKFPQGPPGYARSSAIVENFLCFDADDPCSRDSGVDVSTPRDTLMSPWIWQMRTASQASSRYRSLYAGRETLGSPLRPVVPGSIGSPR